jgi:hypothetical protein
MRIVTHDVKIEVPKQGNKAESIRTALIEAVKKIPAQDLEKFVAGQILIVR